MREEVKAFLEVNPNLEVKALFGELQRRYPDKFQPGQLRILQRRVKQWRVTEGPSKEVFFDQEYKPGDCAQSDFTRMNELGVTIQGEPFEFLGYRIGRNYRPRGGSPYIGTRPSKKSVQSICRKISAQTAARYASCP